MHTKITKSTTFEQFAALCQDYELVLSRVKVDQDGFNITLSEPNGQTIALGMAPTLHEALEDAFQDVDGLAVTDTRQPCAQCGSPIHTAADHVTVAA